MRILRNAKLLRDAVGWIAAAKFVGRNLARVFADR